MKKIFAGVHTMIDIETMSTNPNATIIQLAAAKFSLERGIFDEFIINIDPNDCKQYNCDISKETLLWWKDKPLEIRKSLFTNQKSLREAIESFTAWYGVNSNLIWCNGGSFDFPVISWAYIELGIERPWKYWNEMDLRTLSTFFDYRLPKSGTTHNALDDTKHQINHILKLMKSLSE